MTIGENLVTESVEAVEAKYVSVIAIPDGIGKYNLGNSSLVF